MTTLEFTPSQTSTKKQILGQGYLHFDRETGCFSCEISDLAAAKVSGGLEKTLMVINTKTRQRIIFQYSHKDMDGSGEDIYGWHYKSVSGHTRPCSLLIIND